MLRRNLLKTVVLSATWKAAAEALQGMQLPHGFTEEQVAAYVRKDITRMTTFKGGDPGTIAHAKALVNRNLKARDPDLVKWMLQRNFGTGTGARFDGLDARNKSQVTDLMLRVTAYEMFKDTNPEKEKEDTRQWAALRSTAWKIVWPGDSAAEDMKARIDARIEAMKKAGKK
jgi:hypothetical protein